MQDDRVDVCKLRVGDVFLQNRISCFQSWLERCKSFAHILSRPGRKSDFLGGRRLPAVDRRTKVLLKRKKQHGKRCSDLREVESNIEPLASAERTDGPWDSGVREAHTHIWQQSPAVDTLVVPPYWLLLLQLKTLQFITALIHIKSKVQYFIKSEKWGFSWHTGRWEYVQGTSCSVTATGLFLVPLSHYEHWGEGGGRMGSASRILAHCG